MHVKCVSVSTCLTLHFVVFGVGRKGPVGEKLGEADARILRLVHHIVPHGLHQSVHELQAGRAQNLNHLIPLVDVCMSVMENPAALRSMCMCQQMRGRFDGALNQEIEFMLHE